MSIRKWIRENSVHPLVLDIGFSYYKDYLETRFAWFLFVLVSLLGQDGYLLHYLKVIQHIGWLQIIKNSSLIHGLNYTRPSQFLVMDYFRFSGGKWNVFNTKKSTSFT
jgi:hypothetical protein